ncbi:MAG: PAS domain-containing protein [Nitrospirota bacterium]|nr:PAS domain-containing protein [Nitrospirota bacterium]MDP2383960.1 PAS domain-containing protein [Nitrospirota bacterium]MDP3597019.1 PAS domain-containing protein [Nitrospirota bacterium]
MSTHTKAEALRASEPAIHTGEPIEHCYRAIMEASSSAILLLSTESIILEWNPAAEVVSGWTADEALGRSYVELCLPIERRESFLAELMQVAEGGERRGLESPLRTRTGALTMLSWNMSRVVGAGGRLIGLIAIGTAMVPHTPIEEELRLAQTHLHHAERRALLATEKERCRIARELHDEFGQALTGLTFDLAWLNRKLSQAPAFPDGVELPSKVRAMSGSVDRLLDAVRTTATALRPAMLDDLGLIPALENLATTFQDRTGAQCAVAVTPELSSLALPSEISAAVFRITQELLTNVMRHAAASQVQIRLSHDGDNVRVDVTDNGKGISPERLSTTDSFGLRGMQERASLLGGHFHIVGTAGLGTTAWASLPLAEFAAP